jgi:hypothetical protein
MEITLHTVALLSDGTMSSYAIPVDVIPAYMIASSLCTVRVTGCVLAVPNHLMWVKTYPSEHVLSYYERVQVYKSMDKAFKLRFRHLDGDVGPLPFQESASVLAMKNKIWEEWPEEGALCDKVRLQSWPLSW